MTHCFALVVRRGFTLIELLVVAAIVGVSIGLSVPAAQKYRAAEQRAACADHLRRLGVALHHYDGVHGLFPAGVAINPLTECASDCRGRSMWALLLPYIDQDELARRYDYSVGFNTAPNYALGEIPIALFTCPGDTINGRYPNRRNYFGVVGGQTLFSHGWRGDVFIDGMFALNLPQQRRDITDGLANTFAVGESHLPTKWGLGPGYADANVGGIPGWIQGSSCANPDCTINNESYGRDLRATKYPINALPFPIADDQDNDVAFGSLHPGGCNFLFADGRAVLIRETIDMTVYRALSTCAGGELWADGAY